jgi:WD40 repeat protein
VISIVVDQKGFRVPTLVSTGGGGVIRFWDLNKGEKITEIDCEAEGIYAIKSNKSCSILYAGDSGGFLLIYDIKKIIEENDNSLLISFQAHTDTITGIDLIETQNLVITCSVDSTVRIFRVLF